MASPRSGAERRARLQEARLYPSLTTAETLAVARERQLLTRSMVAAALGQPVSVDSETDTRRNFPRAAPEVGRTRWTIAVRKFRSERVFHFRRGTVSRSTSGRKGFERSGRQEGRGRSVGTVRTKDHGARASPPVGFCNYESELQSATAKATIVRPEGVPASCISRKRRDSRSSGSTSISHSAISWSLAP